MSDSSPTRPAAIRYCAALGSVGAGLVPAALGSDTGGSVRIPAALCGTVGLKTTVGRISRSGVYPLSWTLDTVGPLTRSVDDAALVYQALQDADLADETTLGVPTHDVLAGLRDGVKGLRLAFAETRCRRNGSFSTITRRD